MIIMYTPRDNNIYLTVLSHSLLAAIALWTYPFLVGLYADTSFPYIPQDQISFELIRLHGTSSGASKGFCPSSSPLLKGMNFHAYELLSLDGNQSESAASSPILQSGGSWQPSSCQAVFESVIIVPYRNRPKQLQVFLKYMHPFLQRQQLHYRVIVVEQTDEEPFNRARLLNIGFVEAKKLDASSYCFIFHDVDLLPLNDYNTYACTHNPRHMYSGVDIFRFHLPYRGLAGGAFSILRPHFEAVNGYSNHFEGWGGEDDDFSRRLREEGLTIERFDPRVAQYLMIPHGREMPSGERWHILRKNARSNFREDGLTSLEYKVLRIRHFPLYTHLYVS